MPKPVARLYLMLDFDGVLHPEGCAPCDHFCRLGLLEDALRELPGVRIVISSMWRLEASLPALRRRFAPDIAERIVGMTPDLFDAGAASSRGLRQRECEAWIAAHDPGAAWVALDDRVEGFDDDCRQLVAVKFHADGGEGLEVEHLEALARRVRGLPRGA